MLLAARLVTSRILEGHQEQNFAVVMTAPNLSIDGTIRRPPLSLAIVIAYDHGGMAEAQQVLERRSQAVRANAAYLGAEMVESLEAVSRTALDGFARAPDQAKKVTSVKAYELAR